MERTLPATLLLLALGASACRTTHTERIAPPTHARVEEGQAARAWEVAREGEVVGQVVAFRSAERPEETTFVIQNPWGQDLGLVDGLGRAWRFRPHQDEAEWLGTGTVAEGAARILDAPGCALREIVLERAREAALRR